MAKRKKTFVYVPQVDKIFSSIADAARALQVDAGNISKVLKGKRKTAGGFNFISATGKGGGKKRKSTLQRQAAALAPADPLERKRQQLRESVTAANKQLKRLKDAGLYDFSAAAKSVLGLADDLGRTSAGYLATSGKRFEKLSEAQIDKYLEVLDRKKKLRSYTVEGATAEAERLANNFGTTAQRIIELSDALPLFFNVLKNQQKDYNSDDVLDDITAFDNPEVGAEFLMQEILDLHNEAVVLQAIADTLDGDDLFMLDKYLPIQDYLQDFVEAYKADPKKHKKAAEEIRDYIRNSYQYEEVDEVNNMIIDTIQTALRG